MLRARIGGLVFDGRSRNPEEGFIIDPDGWSGWDEGTAVRRGENERTTSHGSFDVPGFLTARVTSISGWILASSPWDLAHMRTQLTGLLADGQRDRLTVDGSDGTTWADVRLAGQTSVKVRGQSELEAAFQVQFWAPDPRRYGQQNLVGPAASVQAFHYGNFPATPKITVTGTAPSGYTVNGPAGRQFVVTRALTAAAPHTIDMATGWLSIGGVVQVGGVGRADTWAVPPGSPVTMSVTAGSLTVDTLDTFI